MSDDSNGAVEREPLSADRRATPAGIDIVAFCRSLPPNGRLSADDIKVLKDIVTAHRDNNLSDVRWQPIELMLEITHHGPVQG